MESIADIVRALPGFVSLGGVDDEAIAAAEGLLEVMFALDYRECLREFGAFCANGHEVTGICASPRLNVVEASRDERALNRGVRDDVYLIERYDGISIWQSSSGEVIRFFGDGTEDRIADSLAAYLTEHTPRVKLGMSGQG